MEENVYEGVSDNNKTITQPLNNAHSCPIYVGKFTSEVPSCGFSMEDDEGIDRCLRLLMALSKWSFNSMRKVRDVNSSQE